MLQTLIILLIGIIIGWIIEWFLDWRFWRADLDDCDDGGQELREQLREAQAEVIRLRNRLGFYEVPEVEAASGAGAVGAAAAGLTAESTSSDSLADSAETDSTATATPSASEPDRLRLIHGIGPTYESRFHEAEVYTFADLAELSPERAREIAAAGVNTESMVDAEAWIEEARERAERASGSTEAGSATTSTTDSEGAQG